MKLLKVGCVCGVVLLCCLCGQAEEYSTVSGRFKRLGYADSNGDNLLDKDELYHFETRVPVSKDEFARLLSHVEFKAFLCKRGLLLRDKKLFEIGGFKKSVPTDYVKEVTIQVGVVNSATRSSLQLGIMNHGSSTFGRFGFVNRTDTSNLITGGTEGVHVALIKNHLEGDLKGASIALFNNYIGGDVNGLATSLFTSHVGGDVNGVLGAIFYNRIVGVSQGVLAGLFNRVDKPRSGVILGMIKEGTQWYEYIDWRGILTFILFGSFLRFRSKGKKEESSNSDDGEDTQDEHNDHPTSPDDTDSEPFPQSDMGFAETDQQASPYKHSIESSQQEMVHETTVTAYGVEKIPGGGETQEVRHPSPHAHLTPQSQYPHSVDSDEALLNPTETNLSIEEMIRQ